MTFPAYPANKDSGVEWLGQVPEHWSITPLKFSASCNDTVLPDSTDDEYEIEYVEISDVNEISGITGSTSYKFSDAPSRARRTLQDGDVLISTVRTYLRAIAPVVNPRENLIASTGFAVVRPRKGILDGTFLGYLLRAEWWISEVIARSVGVSYPAINASDLIGLNAPVPAWHEQTQIARFLDHETARIDALIEEQQRLIELLKEKRQAVISHAVTKGLDPTVPMKDSGVEWLGEVPAHWSVKRIRFLLKENGLIRGPFGGDLKKETFVENGIKVYEQKNAIYRNFRLGNSFITQDKFSGMRRFEVKAGDYIMSCSGTIGRAYRIPEEAPVGIINQALLVIRFSEELAFNFTDWIFVADFFANQILDNSQGGAMKNLVGMDIFTSISMPVPPMQEQLSIAKYLMGEIDSFDALINTANQAVNLMQERRSALISAAVTGKIDVRGWQQPVSTPSPELAQEAV